ncbi:MULTISPECIES: hypothetical protein [unclassified Rathayibacter]|uniref:hypothetical protein n=1 Tax=unclassified Rathayibacter TaxID=2609250 RepID=UPI001FB294F9|nr:MULTISPECIES: hypothetical protein [unclassified Rathayibacter]MCJ1672123.1 hypothetical protein [Rathayibacter sp. VKM Ac-2929]MCJ1683508.1 hypothetical protein [Rathayibacter sp. VKM Ac-2928]
MTVSAALSLVLLGGAATAAHADEPSPGTATVTAHTATPSPATVPVQHPGVSARLVGTLDKKDGEPASTSTTVTWRIEATNTGDVTLKDLNGSHTDLAPGETTTHLFWQTKLTQEEIDAGTATFTAGLSATTPDGAPYTSPTLHGTLTLPVEHPGVSARLVGTLDKKDGEPATTSTTVTWRIEATNTGDVTLKDLNGSHTDLAPGETTTHLFWQTKLTQEEIDAGTATFTAGLSATTPDGAPYTSPTLHGTLTLPVQHPGIDGHFTGVLDTKDGEPVTAGAWITWTAELANTGDVELSTIDGIDVDLAPGETTDHFSWRRQVTQADLDAGSVSFSKTYDATTIAGTRYTSDAITGTMALPAPAERPRLSGEFEGHLELKNDETVKVGTRITWIVRPVNTGDVELRAINDTTMVLTPGQPAPAYQVRAQVTQADLDAGSITFSRTFSGTTPLGTRYSTPFTGTLTLPTGPAAG